MANVAVFGVGYVGCVTAACLARDGHRVIGVDIDPGKVEMLNRGESPVAEPGLEELVTEQVAQGRLSATEDLDRAVRETQIALIAVGTPSERDGAVSTKAVKAVVESIGRVLRDSGQEYAIVVRSTLLPGILEDELAPLLSEAAGRSTGDGLRICNNPEFLRESTAIRDYDDPPFVVVGTTDDWDARAVLELYADIDAEQIVTDTRSAALVKYACNAFHALKVAFANEIGSFAKLLGGDGQKVMELVCRDTKLNISSAYLRPGFAFGGSCLPKDVRAIARYAEREALRLSLLGSLMASNGEHIQRAIDAVEQTGHRQVGIVGLSFKTDTDDLRESPFVTLVETLVGRGYDVKIFDPNISVSRLRGRNLAYIDQHLPHLAALLVDDPAELYKHASLCVVCTGVAKELNLATDFAGDVIDLREDLVKANATLAPIAIATAER